MKIVAISLDKEQAILIKRLKEEDCKDIDYYRMKKGWDEENKLMQ